MSGEQTQVVVGFDFSESARFALERAITLAVVEVEPATHRRAFRFTYDEKLGVAEPLRWPGA